MMEVGDWWRGKWRIMVMLTVLHIVGILIFTRGFLLTRTELPHYSNCSDVSDSPCFTAQSNPYQNQSNPRCWTRPAVDRLVIIVLDALRYSFWSRAPPMYLLIQSTSNKNYELWNWFNLICVPVSCFAIQVWFRCSQYLLQRSENPFYSH